MKTVLVAMSGGVDSAAAAKLLLQAGHRISAVTMLLTALDEVAAARAQQTCALLGIEHSVIDLKAAFKEQVIERYVADYRAGLTPNPCMVCNQKIKFGLLFEHLQTVNCDYLATGHYAQIVRRDGLYWVARAANERRDQSYFLYHLNQSKLRRLLLPLGEYRDKAEVVSIATALDKSLLKRPESVGVCFANGADYDAWLTEKVGDLSGDIVDQSGAVLGQHDGYYRYTIGQKRGIPADLPKDYCVLKIDAARKRLIVGAESACYSTHITLDECHFNSALDAQSSYRIKIFNWGYFLAGRVIDKRFLNGTVEIVFIDPVRAVAAGQYAVLYDEWGTVIGGGRIIS
ncbi:MAG: tRNA 2-thiouridine(34) synthase MnmA [Clostridiales bacterium]|nr:MAG: tRNA 2-thiouridine(34) synthase MnmA [Clostridiales bacterium]